MQDYVDTLRKHEDSFQGMGNPKLINASGKEDLGGGVSVGITAASQDTLLAFEARRTPAETGTVTGSPASPIAGQQIIQDTAALFQTANVARGSLVVNFTDNSIADVISVDSETQLTTKTLVNGTGNTYDVLDVYHVFNIVQVTATGGNLTAVDSAQTTISPILPTAFTQVLLTSSSSATATGFDEQVQDLADRIEQTHRSHPSFGTLYYWNPENGSDFSDGQTRATGIKTWAAVHAKLSPGDSVTCISPSPAHGFVVDQIILTVDNIQIRGAGDLFWIKPATDVVPLIFNGSNNSSIRGVRISKATAGSANGINILSSDRTLIKEVNIHQETGDCVYISDSYMPYMKDSWFHGCTGNGITGVTGCNHLRVDNCFISNNAGDGINLAGTGIKSTQIGWGTKVQFSGGWGLNLDSGPRRIAVDSTAIMHNNTSGDINYVAANQVNFSREIANAPVANLQRHVEALRDSHYATGIDCYLDPINGDDAHDGTTVAQAVKTWAVVEANLNSGDTVNLVANPATATTVLAERIVTTKSNIHVKGPGQHFHVHPLNGDAGSVVELGTTGTHATGCSMSGFSIYTSDLTATNNGISMFGDDNLFENMSINQPPGDGFRSQDCGDTMLRNIHIHDAGDQAIHITNCQELVVEKCFLDNPTNAAIRIDGNGSGDSSGTDLINNVIKDASTGIHIFAGSTTVRIRADNRFVGTVTTQINDSGTDTHNEFDTIPTNVWANSAALSIGKFIALGKALFKGKDDK